ncbi:glycoside hydrolase family 71 protein [Dendrothele bispora CBS 962.96]|uniref:Glycoside hydrolase family 71 protein n=1 Tax=Dendrothele bispora (strain CBS 962.96) TaxID=1314807 RepID=A0A4S8LW00_DENBC|nr:glycoside hydrolase family 71 protein [Dendrothele bispora CBS 962.96]
MMRRASLHQLLILVAGSSFVFGLVQAHLSLKPKEYRLAESNSLRAVQVNPTIRADAQNSSGKLVFCHFIIGIVSNRRNASDYDDDMTRAKATGIDAFALNIGTDSYTDTQLEYAYASAAKNNMKVFLSFDFNWYNPSQVNDIASKISHYASYPAQLLVDNKTFVSSFVGDGLNVTALRAATGRDIYFAPNFHPGQSNFSTLDAAFNWMGWRSNGNNKAPTPQSTVTVNDGDQSYNSSLKGKDYLAPVSPWFSTHFGAEVSYSKNWVFPSDLLWYQRWLEILSLQPRFVEIVSWNDYGESHYIGPLSSPHTDDGSSKWANDMRHTGWLEMAKPFIAAYKSGSSSVNSFITQDQLIYWYRITSKTLNCDSTDTTMGPAPNASGNYFQGRPNGYDSMSDNVFVISLLTSPGTVTVISGSIQYTFNATQGASAFSVPFGIGSQRFSLNRGGKQVMTATSLKPIQNTCPCGLYNFNAYVGTVPAEVEQAQGVQGRYNVLQPDGLTGFTNGLKVNCTAKPSLAATPPGIVAATATSPAAATTPTMV